jgi:ribosomal protein L7/L12
MSQPPKNITAVNPLTDKVPMIKYVRDRWGLALQESKNLVDEWYAEMQATFDKMIGITESEQRVLDGNR